MIFLNSLDLFNHAEVTLLALTTSKPVGSRVYGAEGPTPTSGHYGHPPNSIIIFFSISPPILPMAEHRV